MRLPSGRKVSIGFQNTDSKRTVLSVGEAVEKGYSFVFSRSGSYMTRGNLEVNTTATEIEMFDQRNNLFFLRGDVRNTYDEQKNNNVLAPVEEQAEPLQHFDLPPFDQDAEEQAERYDEQRENWVQQEESNPPRAVVLPELPTQREIDEHNLTHWPSAK